MQTHSSKNGSLNLGRSLLYGVLLGLGIALVFMAGFVFRDLVQPASASASAQESYPLLDEVQALLDQHYLRPQPDYTQRQYAAIRGVLNALGDRFTFFIEPPVAASEADVLSGTYGGIGVQLQRTEAGEIALYPFADSPAAANGIENGDVLRAVNGTPLDPSLSQDAVDQLLRGEVKEGSGVEITVFKPATETDYTTFIPFAVINVPSVVWRVLAEDERIGYVQVMRFTARTPDELTAAFDELRAVNISALVLDMRNNTGGLLQESIQVADEFIDSGVIVYERDSDDERSYDAHGGGGMIDLPLIVLVNNMTASGAELVAGALRDSGRAILIGQTTYGKGTVQQIFALSDQSSLHITAAEWFTPSRQPLDAVGLAPDVAMIPDPTGRDVELGEAVRRLQEEL
jgi:carboxyl-terminal processing protease